MRARMIGYSGDVDAGKTWKDRPNIPLEARWVTDILASQHNAGTLCIATRTMIMLLTYSRPRFRASWKPAGDLRTESSSRWQSPEIPPSFRWHGIRPVYFS
jgi:hypothetical protein